MNKQHQTNNSIKNGFQLLSSIKIMIFIIVIGLISGVVWFAQSTDEGSKALVAVGSTAVLPEITVYKSVTCTCCNKWVNYLEDEGFTVTTRDKNDNEMASIKTSLGVKTHLASCHTATVGDYVIEGHVPAADIIQLLTEKPETVGLTAPGMPKHSPGMQPAGEKTSGYDVLQFDKEGNTQIFHSY